MTQAFKWLFFKIVRAQFLVNVSQIIHAPFFKFGVHGYFVFSRLIILKIKYANRRGNPQAQ